MISSRVNEGYSASRSSTVSPLANMRTTWWTGIRVPLTHACPWQTCGSIEIRSYHTSVPSGVSVPPSHLLARHIRQRCDELRRIVQHLRAQQADAPLGRVLSEEDVYVVQNLDVVAHEADRAKHY